MSELRKMRHSLLLEAVGREPFITDKELASLLSVSIGTIRLDRGVLGVPELRERAKIRAEEATRKLRSISKSEIVGDLLELQPNEWALSVLKTGREMAFRKTNLIWDHYLFAQASSLAVAVIAADSVIIDSMRGECKGHALIGDTLIARAKVGTNKEGATIVSVRTRVGDREIFVGRFIIKNLGAA